MKRLKDGAEHVSVHIPTEVGRDGMNAPVMEWRDVEVEGVLVKPGPAADLPDADRPNGIRIEYTLAFPKTWTEPLEGCDVTVRGRRLHVVGVPKLYSEKLAPGAWNALVEVGGADG